MADHVIQNREFNYPERIVNQRVFDVMEHDKETKHAWWTTHDGVLKMMRLMLDGPHDEIDWGAVELEYTMTVFNGFFPYCAKKVRGSDE